MINNCHHCTEYCNFIKDILRRYNLIYIEEYRGTINSGPLLDKIECKRR